MSDQYIPDRRLDGDGDITVSKSPIIACNNAVAHIEGFRYEGPPLNLGACSGEMISIIGPDYSGKSAWLRMISGKEINNSGDITIFGKNLDNYNRADWIYLRTKVAYVETDTALLSAANGLRNIMIPALYHATERATHALERAKRLMNDIAPDTDPDLLPAFLRKDECYKIAIARALILQPKAVILDSPFSLLDAATAVKFKSFLINYAKENNVLIIIVTHDIQFALQHSDKILFVSKNNIEPFTSADELHSNDNSEINEFLKLHPTT